MLLLTRSVASSKHTFSTALLPLALIDICHSDKSQALLLRLLASAL